jgi:hypothetical protein
MVDVSEFRRTMDRCLDAAWRAKSQSGTSWRNLNSGIHGMLRNLILLGVEFSPDDFAWIWGKMRDCGDGEDLYTLACGSNISAAKSIESHRGRQPFLYREWDRPDWRGPDRLMGAKRRAHVGAHVRLPDPDGVWRAYTVSSFNDELGRINLMPGTWGPINPGPGTRQRVAMSHAEFVALFPADPKPKTPTVDALADLLILVVDLPQVAKGLDGSHPKTADVLRCIRERIFYWKPAQRREAAEWAGSEMAEASDNEVNTLEKPAHVLRLERDWLADLPRIWRIQKATDCAATLER